MPPPRHIQLFPFSGTFQTLAPPITPKAMKLEKQPCALGEGLHLLSPPGSFLLTGAHRFSPQDSFSYMPCFFPPRFQVKGPR